MGMKRCHCTRHLRPLDCASFVGCNFSKLQGLISLPWDNYRRQRRKEIIPKPNKEKHSLQWRKVMFSPTAPNCFSVQWPPNTWTWSFLSGNARPMLHVPVQEPTKKAKQFICCHTAKLRGKWPNSPTHFAAFTPPPLPLTKTTPRKIAKLLQVSFSPLLL